MSDKKPVLAVSNDPIDSIRPYPKNPRKNAPEGIGKVAAAIREYGWRQPIVVDEDRVIVVGHTRYAAARSLGLTHVPVHVAKELSKEAITAYRIADNRTHEESRWNEGLLKIEIGDLNLAGFDLSLTGFDNDELRRMLDGDSRSEPITDSLSPGAARTAAMKFGSKVVPLTDAELKRLDIAYREYCDMNMGPDGFARWLCTREAA